MVLPRRRKMDYMPNRGLAMLLLRRLTNIIGREVVLTAAPPLKLASSRFVLKWNC